MRAAGEKGLNQGTSCPHNGLGRDARGRPVEREMESGMTLEMDFVEPGVEVDEDGSSGEGY